MKAVFMPYLASMWDALESVWMEYGKDPLWETAVVPIPYYDRNPDRSFGQLHYEGERFPEYVPVVPYETYDLEKEHPDVIYIHNPIDDINLVTSVHPDYYSAALKNIISLLRNSSWTEQGYLMIPPICIWRFPCPTRISVTGAVLLKYSKQPEFP